MSDHEPSSQWDQAAAEALLGTRVLIGIDVFESNGDHAERFQLHGIIERIDEHKGLLMRLPNGEHYTLPPWPSAFHPADPDDSFSLKSTDEEVTGIQFTAMWDITRPDTE